MSDYLENLAARAIGMPDSLQPRMPSLFEPASNEYPASSSFCRIDDSPGFELKAHEAEQAAVSEARIQNDILLDPARLNAIFSAAAVSDDEKSEAAKSNNIQSRATMLNASQPNGRPLHSQEQAAASIQEETDQFSKEKNIKLSVLDQSPKQGDEHKPGLANEHSGYSSLNRGFIGKEHTIGKDREKIPLVPDEICSKPDRSLCESTIIAMQGTEHVSRGENQEFDPKDESRQQVFGQAIEIDLIPDIRSQSRPDTESLYLPSEKERADTLTARVERTDYENKAAQVVQAKAEQVVQADDQGEKAIDGPAVLHDTSFFRQTDRRESSINPKKITQASQEPLGQMPPSIKVTIGRIEVRVATRPEKRETRTESKTPSSSLENYLISLRGKSR